MLAAASFAERLRGGEVIGLEGALGSGKTTFVRGLAGALGVPPMRISSPTFVLCQIHRGGRLTLVHADAYRLHESSDTSGLGLEESVGDPSAVIAIEWPQAIESALPADRIHIEFVHIEPEGRLITATIPPGWAAAFATAVGGWYEVDEPRS